MKLYRRNAALFAAALFVSCIALAQPLAKRPIQHRDYDGWRTIQNQALSVDGKFLAYALIPEEGDGELVVRNLTTGAEHREKIGSPPPAQTTVDFEQPTQEDPLRTGIRPTFTSDTRFLITNAFPSKADAKKTKPGLLIVDLTSFEARRMADVASFQVPENGGSLVAYLKSGVTPAEPTAPPEDDLASDQQRRASVTTASSRTARPQFGSDLVLTDLSSNPAAERTFADVTEYRLSKDGRTLVYAVSSRNPDSNGLYQLTRGNNAAPVALASGKGRYTRPTWDRQESRLAFLSDHDNPPKFKLYLWDRKSSAPMELASVGEPSAISDTAGLTFSRDGSRLFLSTVPSAALPAPAPATPPSEDKVVADLWRWNDDYVQPMQRARAAQDRTRSFRAVVHIADKKFVQLADPTLLTVFPNESGLLAVGSDNRRYRRLGDFDGAFADYYILDTVTGARKLIFEKHRGGFGAGAGRPAAGATAGAVSWSPDGRHFLIFKDSQWYSVTAPSGEAVNLTARLGVAFHNEENDRPAAAGSYGNAGWTKDGKLALLYDRYDIWAVSPDGVARNITAGAGRRNHLQFRISGEPEEEQRGVDSEKPLLLRAENLDTRDSGFFKLTRLDGRAEPTKLLMGAKNYRILAKAKAADVIVATATTFNNPPELQITDSTFRELRQVTESNPQKARLLWGTGELISYKNIDGVSLRAALYKPENFDPSKKYPMMVFLYERLSQNVHNFTPPRPATSINIPYYVSNGYLVLTPDIIYSLGEPGQSALKCVLPAIQAVVDKGSVDEKAIGIQGHSWGGYQIAYMLTQTNRFRAAEAGAPVGNMTSAYNGIRWGTGQPRQVQYEKTQSRIGGTLWEYPLRYLENSPVFHVDRVTTPLMIIHNDGDDAVPWYQGIELFMSLRRFGKEVYLFNYNGEPHGLRRRINQKDYTVRMQQFFDHFLKGAPAPEWMEKGVPYLEREREKEQFLGTAYGEPSSDQK
jgi:dipeptidyl aminopeptidase/acylaminoacyl peptidase